ncbi:MarR family winged helix-turn-helix transcriptional regulator [Phenylobacterium terrae]|uniref:MarR family winged helix-turn-helix transcriptional regulator n=1 Tax=Phenylobacterium terrae TaxID=2665495 RepID=A0ABW4MWC2_9CAUL
MDKVATPAEAAPEVDLGVLNDVIGFRIRRIQNHLSRQFLERITDTQLRPGGFSALALIAANPGLDQTTLARAIGFDKATVVALLDGLESLGWAERRRQTEDRRRHALFITAEGETALARLSRIAQENEAAAHATLTEAEQAELYRLLDKIYAACFSEPEL